MRWLAREALRAGARVKYGTCFAGAERGGNRFRIAGLDLAARYILGARSAVARHFGLGRNERFLVGVEAEFEGLDTVDPRFRLKRLMRFDLDFALPNMLVDAAIVTPPMRWLAAHVYFHCRSATGISFAEFETRLAASAGERPRPARSEAV